MTVYGAAAVAKAEKIKSSNQEKAAEAAAIIAGLIATQAAAIHYSNLALKQISEPTRPYQIAHAGA